MGKTTNSLTSMVGGEWSPKLDGRADQQKYGSALRQCLNMIPLKQGPLTRAPGTEMIAPAKYGFVDGHNYGVRLEQFTFSPTTTFMLELGHHYIRFYSNGKQVSVTVESLPFWVNIYAYNPGDFVQRSGVAYYCILAVSAQIPPSANNDPSIDPTHWTPQTILEQYTPYGADSGYLANQAWISTNAYAEGEYVLSVGISYRCILSIAGAIPPAANSAPASDSTHWVAENPDDSQIYGTDVWKLAFCQINDVVYITHPDYPVYSLTRYSDVDWVMTPVPFLTPALLDQNATNTQITPSATTGDGITLSVTAPAWATAHYYEIGNSVLVSGIIYTAIVPHVSAAAFLTDLSKRKWEETDVFNQLHVGSTWQLAFLRPSAYIEYTGTAGGGFTNGTSGTIKALGDWEVHTYGVWSSDIAIERSLDGGTTWDTVRSVTGRSDRNVDIQGTAVQLGLYRIVVTNSAALVNAGATNPRIVFECVDAFLYGLVKITAVGSAISATANVVTELANTNPTEYWSEAAWSEYRGYPQAVTSFQQRVIYASSGFEPQRIWGTRTNDIENFYLGDQTKATDSFAFDLNAPSRGPIEWLIAQTDLFAGFSGAEWVINSGSTNQNGQSSGAAITATSINAVEHSTWGSAPGVSPCIVGDAVVFSQRQATSLRQMMFSIYTTKYMSQDLTVLSDHMFASGMVQLAYMTRWHKQSIIWVITKQGILCGMTYELDQEIFGWHRHQTGFGQIDPNGVPIPPDNGFESVATITGSGINDDEVWLVANRLIGGAPTRFIERMSPYNWEEAFSNAPTPPTPDLSSAFYVDCGLTILSPGTLAVPGLDHLEGRYVVGLADGTAFGPILVTGGVATLPDSIDPAVAKVIIGLPKPYAGQPMRIDADPRIGNTQGMNKQLSDVFVRVWNSMGGEISNGTLKYPNFVGGSAYLVGDKVMSVQAGSAFVCVVATSDPTDPVSNATNWAATPTPVYSQPVPIPYTNGATVPFAQPTLVTTPTDIRIGPMLMPTITADPVFMVQGNDALPLTVLALVYKYDVTSVA